MRNISTIHRLDVPSVLTWDLRTKGKDSNFVFDLVHTFISALRNWQVCRIAIKLEVRPPLLLCFITVSLLAVFSTD